MIGDTNVRAMPVAAGTQISTLEVGTLVKMNLQGAPWEWRIVHQGLPGSMYDQSCDGCWLLLENIYENRQWNSSNVNDYENSTINAYLNLDFFGLLDIGIQSQVKEVKIPYRPGSGASKTVNSGANGLSCKIFLLSATEVSFDFPYMPTNEGAELSYFAGCADTGADSKRVANFNGVANNWWLRSPSTDPYSSDSALHVYTDGTWYPYSCSLLSGIHPTLILPNTALVDDDLNVLAA